MASLDQGRLLCHGHVVLVLVVVVVILPNSTRYVGIAENNILIFDPQKK